MSHSKKKQQAAHGVYLQEFKPQTTNQYEYIRAIAENDVVLVNGVAGTGKTFMAIGLACQYLIQGNVNTVLYSRSIVDCDNSLGAFPGDVGEKCHPYLLPALDYFTYFIGRDKVEKFQHYGNIQLFPVELLRGHTYNNALMILDEAQNVTKKQMKLFLTRMGKNSKILILGDSTQSDIGQNGFDFCLKYMTDIPHLQIVKLGPEDIQRHAIIPEVLKVFESNS